jgi:hypothetical protein
MISMLKKMLKRLVPQSPSTTEPASQPPGTTQPDSGVIAAMIKPEPGAILGRRWKPAGRAQPVRKG